MSRPILPLPSIASGGLGRPVSDSPIPPQGPGESKRQYTKRGAISKIACRSCRRRKTKCNSERPTCHNCAGRAEQCIYDFEESDRSLTSLRDNNENLAEERNALEALLQALKDGSEEDVAEILRQLRSPVNITTLAFQVARSHAARAEDGDDMAITGPVSNLSRLDQYEQLLHAIVNSSSLEQDEIISRLRRQFDAVPILTAIRTRSLLQPLRVTGTPTGIEREYSNRGQAFGLVNSIAPNMQEPTDFDDPQAASWVLPRESWTTVTQDANYIEHLFRLYFSWQHTFFQNLPEHLFRADYASGGTRYCSSFLVNAICASGCLLSKRAGSRRIPEEPKSAGLDFYDAAILQLKQNPASTLCTTAGLGILANFEASRGRLSSMWNYCGQSGRMALDLGLHLRQSHDTLAENEDDRISEEARMHTFWGAFITDQVTSFSLGRLPQIPINGVTTGLPPLDEDDEQKPWVAYHDSSRPVVPGACSSTFREVISLCITVNSTLALFFSPAKEISATLLLNEHRKYVKWQENLPRVIATTHDATPHVLCAHLLWHAAVLLLFRPFLKAKIADSKIVPQEICRHSANAISELFGRHRVLYDLQGIYSFQIQCLLAACTIHIIHIPAIASTNHFVDACNSLHDLANHNSWALSSIAVLKDLVQKWDRILPFAAEAALYSNKYASDPYGGDVAGPADKRMPDHSLHSTTVTTKRMRLGDNQPRLFAPSPSQPAPLLRPVHSASGDTDGALYNLLDPESLRFEGLDFVGSDFFDPFADLSAQVWNED